MSQLGLSRVKHSRHAVHFTEGFTVWSGIPE